MAGNSSGKPRNTNDGLSDTSEAPVAYLGRDAMVAHPGFLAAEQKIASVLLDVQADSPRTARLMASYKKWLFTHTIFALTLPGQREDDTTSLTPSQLEKALKDRVSVNRNTLSRYLAELEVYGFLTQTQNSDDGRMRVIDATPLAREGMRSWYNGHLACLDQLDGGDRLTTSVQRPDLIFHAQPRMIARILEDAEWRNPTPSMSCFLETDAGGMLVHYMISQIGTDDPVDGRYMLDEIGTPALAERFVISLSNVKRMVRRAEEEGWLGWEAPRRRGRLWVSERFVTDHFRRQAVKFEYVDRAFQEALSAHR